ncbi:MAG TPA: toll/interleukin-1 receptor domain-containing protein [Planctomycetaceae bacterium]|jgi:hypothetical protein|nr:toll/interleukin-1 receptor domain-containing protein [Planctomycetaceae bacterium]
MGMTVSVEAPPKVVIAHSAADRGLAALLSKMLSQSGIDVLASESEEVTPGTKWVDEIRNRLTRSSMVIFLLTPSAVQSKWLIYEAGAAFALELPVVVVYDGIDMTSVPAALQQFQAVPLSNLDDLIRHLQTE